MKYTSLLACLILGCCGLTVSAATMTISSNPGVDVTVKLALPTTNTEAGPSSGTFVFPTTKGLLGPITNPTSQLGFANSAKNLFAVTGIPATKSAFVHLFLTSAAGNAILITDVNSRVAKLLPQPWKGAAKGFLRVEKIQGHKVKLQTTDFAHAPFQTHTFSVSVDLHGEITLIP